MDTTQTREADCPFDSSAMADVILRSSDNVDFHVLKTFLRYSSPFFDTMFTLPAPIDVDERGIKEGKSVIVMAETSSVIRPLLLLCYPGSPPKIANLDNAVGVATAVEKFDMKERKTCLHKVILGSQELALENPLRLFSLAFRHGWEDVGRLAAKNMLSIPRKSLPFSRELACLSGIEMFQLGSYREACGEAVTTWAEDRDKSPFYISGIIERYVEWNAITTEHGRSCGRADMAGQSDPSATLQWELYRDALIASLRECPRASTIRKSTTALQKSQCLCPSRLRSNIDLMMFTQEVGNEVESIISKIKLDVDFG